MSNIDCAAPGATPARDWAELHRRSVENHVKAPVPARRGGHRLDGELSPSQAEAGMKPIRARTEDGFAIDFVTANQGRIAYLAEHRAWLVWEGHVWARDARGAVTELAREYARGVAERNELSPRGERAPVGAIRSLNSVRGVKAMLELAKADPRVATSVDQFDSVREELNTPGGVVDLRTGAVRPADPSELVMRSTTVEPDWGMETPLFDEFMAQTFAGSPARAEYAMDMLGLSLLAGQDSQTFVLNYGAPASGKSTLMKLVGMLLGSESSGYVTVCDHRMFEKSRNERHATEIARLAGARLVVSSEIAEGKQLDADKFKMLVSGDRLTARFMNKDEFEFDPKFTLWIMSNHKAKAPAAEAAFWRRIKVLEYPHSVPEHLRVSQLDEVLMETEGPGILARIIDRTRAYLEHGMWVPQEVVAETRAHRDLNDSFAGWLEDSATVGHGLFAEGAALLQSYVDWCRLNNCPAMERIALRKALLDAGFDDKRAGGARGYSGLSLRSKARSY